MFLWVSFSLSLFSGVEEERRKETRKTKNKKQKNNTKERNKTQAWGGRRWLKNTETMEGQKCHERERTLARKTWHLCARSYRRLFRSVSFVSLLFLFFPYIKKKTSFISFPCCCFAFRFLCFCCRVVSCRAFLWCFVFVERIRRFESISLNEAETDTEGQRLDAFADVHVWCRTNSNSFNILEP